MKPRRRAPVATIVAFIALFVSLTGTTYAATGGTFLLGRANSAGQVTKLTNPNGTALSLFSKTGTPALRVGNTTQVPNLNASLLGGQSAAKLITGIQTGRATGPTNPVYNNTQGLLALWGGGLMEVQVTKALSASCLVVNYAASNFVLGGGGPMIYGVYVYDAGGVSAVANQIDRWYYNVLSTHLGWSGTVSFNGLPAGSYTVRLRVGPAGPGMTVGTDTNDHASLMLIESPTGCSSTFPTCGRLESRGDLRREPLVDDRRRVESIRGEQPLTLLQRELDSPDTGALGCYRATDRVHPPGSRTHQCGQGTGQRGERLHRGYADEHDLDGRRNGENVVEEGGQLGSPATIGVQVLGVVDTDRHDDHVRCRQLGVLTREPEYVAGGRAGQGDHLPGHGTRASCRQPPGQLTGERVAMMVDTHTRGHAVTEDHEIQRLALPRCPGETVRVGKPHGLAPDAEALGQQHRQAEPDRGQRQPAAVVAHAVKSVRSGRVAIDQSGQRLPGPPDAATAGEVADDLVAGQPVSILEAASHGGDVRLGRGADAELVHVGSTERDHRTCVQLTGQMEGLVAARTQRVLAVPDDLRQVEVDAGLASHLLLEHVGELTGGDQVGPGQHDTFDVRLVERDASAPRR